MNKGLKILLLLGIFLVLQNSFSQQKISVEADFIGVDYPQALTFYKKNLDGSYDKTVLNTSEKKVIHFTELGKHDQFISIEKLEKQSLNKLNRKLKRGFYLNQKKIAHFLRLEKNGFIRILSYKQADDHENWKFQSRYFFNYYLVKVNQKHTLVYLISNNHRNFYGFLLNQKEKVIFSFSTNGDFPLKKKHDYQLVKPKNFPVKILDTFPAPFNLKFHITEKYQLADYFSQKISLDKKLDTLFTRNAFIIGKKNQEVLFYNQKLENITPKRIRNFHFLKPTGGYDFSYPQVLVNNKIFWLSQDGELIENYEAAPRCYESSGWTSEANFIMITQKNGKIWLKDVLLSENNIYEKAWFLNESKELDIQRNYRIDLYENYLIVRKNKKYGLLKYKFNEEKTTLETQLILSVNYDFIYPELFNAKEQGLIIENNGKYGLLLLKTDHPNLKKPLPEQELNLPIIYDEISYLDSCHPFLLKKNGLVGYSGIHEKPKYKKLEKFYYNYARFTLPNGKKGWLNRTGEEFLDE